MKRMIIAASGEGADKIAAIKNGDQDAMEKYFKDSDPKVRAAVAQYTKDEDLLGYLSKDDDEDVLLAVIKNAKTPKKLIIKIAATCEDDYVAEAAGKVAMKGDLSESDVFRLSKAKSKSVREMASDAEGEGEEDDSKSERLNRLLNDKDEDVVYKAILKTTDKAKLTEIRNDESRSDELRGAAAKRIRELNR